MGDNCLRQQIDRVLISDSALFVGGIEVRVLHRECSDHASIVCSWKPTVEDSPRRWRFLRAWVLTEGYVQVVCSAWNSIILDPGVFSLQRKLVATRGALKSWNLNSFGNIFDRKSGIEALVLSMEEELVGAWNEESFIR